MTPVTSGETNRIVPTCRTWITPSLSCGIVPTAPSSQQSARVEAISRRTAVRKPKPPAKLHWRRHKCTRSILFCGGDARPSPRLHRRGPPPIRDDDEAPRKRLITATTDKGQGRRCSDPKRALSQAFKVAEAPPGGHSDGEGLGRGCAGIRLRVVFDERAVASAGVARSSGKVAGPQPTLLRVGEARQVNRRRPRMIPGSRSVRGFDQRTGGSASAPRS